MMPLVAVIFVLAYAAIAFEHPLRINKSAVALIAAGLMWTVYSIASPLGVQGVSEQLTEKLAETAAIVFFLICAMTIVEVTDAHGGFEVITSRIKAKKLSTLLWIIAFIAFLLSSILDNMTTTIVMVALMKRLLKERSQRIFFAGIIVIAANAGGAWTPIGDVTTTMLWIGGQVSALGIIQSLFAASVVNLATPLAVVSFGLRGKQYQLADSSPRDASDFPAFERNTMFALGLGVLVLVPAFKQVTHLPPFMGVLFGLGLLWIAGEILHKGKTPEERRHLTLAHALSRIDHSSLLFFVGILLAVATLEHARVLAILADWLDRVIGRQDLILLLLGLLSAIVDNVPLVAASMAMYPLSKFPIDSFLWEFMAYCAGTGGSILIIGSAAGVAAMGMEKIQFLWYMRRIAWLALLGYLAGAAVYVVQFRLMY
jgi:Na+/H+ antiporter NhaD/arsenite permease-like protein